MPQGGGGSDMDKLQVLLAALTLIGGVSGFLYMMDRRRVHDAQGGGEPTTCPVCGGHVPPNAAFCEECGKPLGAHAHEHVHEPEPGPSILEQDATTTDRSEDFAKRIDRMTSKHR